MTPEESLAGLIHSGAVLTITDPTGGKSGPYPLAWLSAARQDTDPPGVRVFATAFADRPHTVIAEPVLGEDGAMTLADDRGYSLLIEPIWDFHHRVALAAWSKSTQEQQGSPVPQDGYEVYTYAA